MQNVITGSGNVGGAVSGLANQYSNQFKDMLDQVGRTASAGSTHRIRTGVPQVMSTRSPSHTGGAPPTVQMVAGVGSGGAGSDIAPPVGVRARMEEYWHIFKWVLFGVIAGAIMVYVMKFVRRARACRIVTYDLQEKEALSPPSVVSTTKAKGTLIPAGRDKLNRDVNWTPLSDIMEASDPNFTSI
jgi:hypothetical protein